LRGLSRLSEDQRRRLKLRITHDEQKHSESNTEFSPKTEVAGPTGKE
jgi:hypothetical protein